MAAENKALTDLVAALKSKGELPDPRLEAAFLAVPRHLFLPDVSPEIVYTDEAVAIKRTLDGIIISSSSQPSMMALMLRQLNLRPGDNVLEIGAGTGYNAALMQYLVGDNGKITSVELDADLAERARDNLVRTHFANVNIVQGDGVVGYAPRAAYDRIIATVGIWDVPVAWTRQLKDDGILVAPLWLDGMQVSAAFRRQPHDVLYSEDNIPCGFVALRGIAAGPAVTQRIGSTDLIISAEDIGRIDSVALDALLREDHESCFLGERLTSNDYWNGIMPYLMLNTEAGYVFVTYGIGENQQAYGMEGSGFALVSKGSAVFVPFHEEGNTHCYAGADAFLEMARVVEAWTAAGRPQSHQLRLRLLPKSGDIPSIDEGKVYTRREHYVHVWLASR
jgi:protein-L-isoaspartate(D-aspartate) O-methyltransferase